MEKSYYHTTINLALVENQVLFSNTLANQLAGYHDFHMLFTAADGLDMQAKIAKYNAPHVVLMDIGMSNMNGYRSTAWLRKHHPEVAVLALSGLDTPEAIQEVLQCGAHGFVSKDQSLADLQYAIREVFIRKKYSNPALKNGEIPASSHRFRERFIDLLNPDRMRVLNLLALGLRNHEIAEKALMSTASVKKHLETLFEHFGVHNRLELVKKAMDMGLILSQPTDKDKFNLT